MEFKENDLVMTRVPMKGTNGFTVAGGCIGVVSVVGVALEDGSTNGIEVLFEGDPGTGTYATYNSTQLTYAPAHSPIPESPEIFIPESCILTKENYLQVAEWCGPDTRIAKDLLSRPRLFVKTGFSEDPNFRVTVKVGDKLEKTKDGKIQVWVRQDNVAWDDGPNVNPEPARFEPENRPAELKKFRTTDPMATAIALVNTLYYDAKLDTGDVYIVWFCATLKNWKALVSTNVKDNSYYEVTHNGEQKETYVDRYVKIMNQHFKIPDEYLED